MKKVLSISFLIAGLCFLGNISIAQDATTETVSTEVALSTLNLDVEGMTCQGCEYKVKSVLQGIDGVVATNKVCSQSDKASLTYDPKKISEEQIIVQLAEKTGYGISVSENTAKAKTECTKSKTECTKSKTECTKSKAECKKSKAECTKSKAECKKSKSTCTKKK